MVELRAIYRTMVTPQVAAALDHFLQPRLREKRGEHQRPATPVKITPQERALGKMETPARTRQHQSTTRSALSWLQDGKEAASAAPMDPVLAQAAAKTAKAAIDRSILHNFYLASVVSEEDILEHALRFAVDSRLSPESFRAAMKQHPDLIFGHLEEQRLVTTRRVLAEERQNVAWVWKGKGTMKPLVLGHQIKEAKLNQGQRAAVQHVLTSVDRMTAIDGRAGTGKTWLMREAVAALEAHHHKVLVMAPTSSAVSRTLRGEFPQAQTVEQLLVNERLQEEYRGGVWWVDEAGQLSGPTMHRLFALVEEQDARVIVSGDVLQHRAIERGDALRMLMSTQNWCRWRSPRLCGRPANIARSWNI